MLEGKSLMFSYGENPVLRGVSVSVPPGESIAIQGPSGCGKSTLLMVLSGLERPSGGTVTFAGQDLWSLGDRARDSLRLKRVGFVFQDANLVPELSLLDNVALPLDLIGVPHREARARAATLIERLGLAEAAGRRPSVVSGGQRQRAAVARAAIASPAVIFADEPTGALDSSAGAQVLELLLELVHDLGAALLLVTHDAEVAGSAHRRVAMRDGLLVKSSGQ